MIQLQQLSIQRGGRHLLDNADLTLHPGWRVGITGRNGTGKSTLFLLLNNQLEADGGSCSIPSHWRIATMAQEVAANDRSALDYVLDGDIEFRRIEAELEKTECGSQQAELHDSFAAIDGYSAPARASTLLHGLGFKPGDELNPVSSFSGGWRIRLNLARALMCPSDLLLLDEPTNHLDLDATLWLEQWLKQYQGTLLLISHDRDFLDQVVNYIVNVEQQKLALYNGNYTTYERSRAERLAQQQIAFEKQQARRAEIESFVNRFRAKATKAKQAQSRLKELARMEDIVPAHSDSGFEFTLPCADKVSSVLLNLDEAHLGYKDAPILEGVSLSILPQQRIGLLGANGAGKSTLIKTLAGKLAPTYGKMICGEHLRIGYFAQHQLEELDPEASPALHLQRLTPKATEQDLRNFLGGYGFPGDRAFEACGSFSGGEKARLALAVIGWQKPNLLLLDEPTNHLDLEMRCALTLALQRFEGAVLLISHDRHLLRATVDEFWLVDNHQVAPFDGDLDSYRQWLSDKNKADNASTETAPRSDANNKKLQRQQAAQQREAQKPLRQKLKKAEQQLEKLQSELDALEATMAKEDFYSGDQSEIEATLKRQGELRQLVDEQEEAWLQLSEALETAS